MASVTITDFAGLSAALQNTDIDEIILGADIIYTTGTGIAVTKSNRTVVIDGTDPVDPGIRHSITDNNTTNGLYGIYVPAISITGAFGLTVRNIRWYGRNYYGITYIVESAYNLNTTLTIDNVYYDGPQMVHNRNGITVLKDSQIFIGSYNSTVCPFQECAETRVLEIQGVTAVNSQATTASTCFWLCQATASFTVAENASFTLSAPNTYMFYIDGGMASMLFGANSVTSVSTYEGMFLTTAATTHTSSTFTIDTGASLTVRQSTRITGVGAIKFNSAFTMNEGSRLDLQVTATGNCPLLKGEASSAVQFNNPKSVILYNHSSNVFGFDAAGNSLTITAELINFWQTASAPAVAGSLDDAPLRAWATADGSNITVNAAMSASAMTSVTSNVSEITAATLNLFACQTLAMGNMVFDVDYVNDSGAFVGKGEPDAALRAVYDTNTIDGTADPDGAIDIVLSPAPALGEEIVLSANKNFLTKSMKVEATASVFISGLSDSIKFKTLVAPSYKSYIRRDDGGGTYIEVTDGRPSGGAWYLYAVTDGQMISGIETLGDILIHKNSDDTILTTVKKLVYTGQWTSPGAVTKITWQDVEGVLLKPVQGEAYAGGDYSATITWTIEY